ncbi:MAG: amino acid aminotransferase [Gammaproteobacteria bacterium]
MFERLERMPDDPILGLMAAYRADPDSRKVDLGVGVYRNDKGETPILDAVRKAEAAVLARQTSKTYVAPAGNAGFNQSMEKLVFGEGHPTLKANRVRTIQAPGGCGALRVGAELIRLANPEAVIHVSTPTWANHVPLLTGSGIKLERYPYYDPATGGVNFSAMMDALDTLPKGAFVLLHASCHNPTGADLSEPQWRDILTLVQRRGLVPYIDMAYQGLGTGIAEDAFGPRLFAAELPEVLVAVSCSKNFGLYRERTGALHVINQTTTGADAILTQLVRIARTIYSMPPDHGAAIVQEILTTEALRGSWTDEVGSMRSRIAGLRKDAVARLATAAPGRDFSFIERQHGMFSFLGANKDQVRELREKHHIYMTDDSRINIAGLKSDNIGYFAEAVAQVLK